MNLLRQWPFVVNTFALSEYPVKNIQRHRTLLNDLYRYKVQTMEVFTRIAFRYILPIILICSLGETSLAQEYETIELNLPIRQILEQKGDETLLQISTEGVSGLSSNDMGTVWSIYREEDPNRAGKRIGRGELITVKDSAATFRMTPADYGDSMEVMVGDLVALSITLPESEFRSVIFELATFAITFTNADRVPTYSLGEVLTSDSPTYQQQKLQEMLVSIKGTAAEFKGYAVDDSTFTTPQTGGRFRGVGMLDAMERSTQSDLLAFLRFVRAFPANYMGRTWGLAETYATWILNNTPISEFDLREDLMDTASEQEVEHLLQTYAPDILNGGFLYDWTSTAEEWAFDGEIDEARRLNLLVKKGAEVIKDREAAAWAYFLDARIAEADLDYELAVTSYRQARKMFEEANAVQGASFALNNLGSVLINLSRFDEAMEAYNAAYKIKLERYKTEGSGEASESLAHTVSGRARVRNALGEYESALGEYEQSRQLYAESMTNTSVANTAWSLLRLADVLNSLGRYEDALNRLDTAIQIYRQLEDRNGEADALDAVAYQYSSMGKYREAVKKYEEAYEAHLEMGDKQDAGFSKSNVGQSYWSLGDYFSAEKAHRLAILLREEAGDFSGQAYSWHKLGEMFRESGDPNAALEAYDKAAKIYIKLGDREKQAEVLSSAGDVYYGQKAWRSALEKYNQALDVQKEIGARDAVATTLYSIGNVYYDDQKYGQAAKIYEESLSIRKEIGDRQNSIYNMTGLGLVAWNLRDYDAAYNYFEKALALAEELESRSDVGWCWSVIAKVDAMKGENDRAVENYTKALAIYREIEYKSGEIDALLGLGNIDVERGEFTKGLKKFSEAEQLARESNSRNQIGDALNATAGVYLLLGEYEKALEVDKKGLEISREVENAWGIGSAFIGVGNTYNAMGEYRAAIEYYNRADSIYKALNDTLARGTPINNIGTVWFFQGDYERALNQFNQVLKILRDAGQEDEFLALVVGNVGEVYYEQGRLKDAETWLKSGLELSDSLDARRIGTTMLTILTKTMIAADRLDEAQAYGERAQKLADAIGEQEQIAETNLVMGELALRREKVSEAETYLKKSVEVSEKIGSTKYLWRPLYHLGIIFRDRGDKPRAIDYLKHSVETIESLRDKVAGGEAAEKLFASDRTKVQVYEALIALLIEEGEIETALGYLERSSSEDLRSRFKSLNPELADPSQKKLLDQGREMKARIDKLAEQIAAERSNSEVSDEKIEKLQEIISIAESDYIRFVTETIREEPELRNYFSAGVNPIELRQRKQKIPNDVAVVSYLLGENQLFVFVATSDTVIARVIATSRSDIEWTVRSLYRMSAVPENEEGVEIEEADALPYASELYNLLIAPVEDQLMGKDKLAIIPSGDLHYLPFGLLSSSPDEPDYLMEKYSIFYVSDLGIFLEEKPRADQPHVMAFGNADNTLPSAEQEVKDIASLYPDAKIYLRAEATEDKAKNMPSEYNTLHFATHGNLDYTHFENSWLTLAENASAGEDGRLTLEEIWGISNLANCRLVTLSACNTAVSDEVVEGWPINPANAFLQVGVPRVVATLWQVDDAATAILMKEFYKNLKDHGAADALKLAQSTLASNQEYAYPYYWAPFVLLGDWR